MQFTPRIGVAPGTTTFQAHGQPGGELSCGSCMQGTQLIFNPYANEARLTGLRGLRGTGIRWDLFALTLGLGFASVLGVALYRRK